MYQTLSYILASSAKKQKNPKQNQKPCANVKYYYSQYLCLNQAIES